MRWLCLLFMVFVAVSLGGCEPTPDPPDPEPWPEVIIDGMPEAPVIVEAETEEEGKDQCD